MNEKISENGVIEDKNEFKFSWRKLCSWLGLFLVVSVPLAGVGLSIMCLSNAKEEEKEEVMMICFITLMIGIILTVTGVATGSLFDPI